MQNTSILEDIDTTVVDTIFIELVTHTATGTVPEPVAAAEACDNVDAMQTGTDFDFDTGLDTESGGDVEVLLIASADAVSNIGTITDEPTNDVIVDGTSGNAGGAEDISFDIPGADGEPDGDLNFDATDPVNDTSITHGFDGLSQVPLSDWYTGFLDFTSDGVNPHNTSDGDISTDGTIATVLASENTLDIAAFLPA